MTLLEHRVFSKYRTSIATFLLLVSGFFLVQTLDYTWAAWQPATCMPASCFCEAIREQIVRQPINTLSSWAFVLAGLIILQDSALLSRQAARPANLLIANRSYAFIFAGSIIIIGLGSVFYHASLSFYGQFLDVFGMYLLTTFMISYTIARSSVLSAHHTLVAYVIINIMLSLVLLYSPELRRYIFGITLITAIGMEVSYARQQSINIDTKYIKTGIAILAVAFVIWITDITKSVCSPGSFYQGHAVWHMLGSIAACCLYLYYRSETTPQQHSQE